MSSIDKLSSEKGDFIPLRSDIYNSIVLNVLEGLDGQVTQYLNDPRAFMSLKTFALMDSPYGSATIKTSLAESSMLNQAFLEGTLGNFTTTFQVLGVQQFEKLSLNVDNSLYQALKNLEKEKVSYSDLKKWIKANLADQIKRKGIDFDEALILTSRYLRTEIMRRTSSGLFTLDSAMLNQFRSKHPKQAVILNDVSEPKIVPCRSVVTLKDGAVSRTTCGDGQ